MKFQNIHAHFDDFEFTAAGTFELARRRDPEGFSAEIVVCTDGAAGHHRLSRGEAAKTREAEQRASAETGKYALKCLTYPDGSRPREGTLQTDTGFLAGMWKVIRDFQPDVLVCPPIPSNNLVGVHVDHLMVAEAVRRVAYLVNVPHAFTPEYPDSTGDPAGEPQWQATPVILNAFDGYMFENEGFDLAVDVSDSFEIIAEESWCHQSQIMEWLPWVHGDESLIPKNYEGWKDVLRRRLLGQNPNVGISSDRMFEFFTLTAWGSCPTLEELLEMIPNVDREISRLKKLETKIKKIKG